VIPGAAIALDSRREHAVQRIDEQQGQSVWIGLDPEVFDELTTEHIRHTMRGINTNTGRAILKPDLKSLLAMHCLVRRADAGTLDPIEAESLLYSVIERMSTQAGQYKPAGRKNAPSRGGGVYKDAVAHTLKLLSSHQCMSLEDIGAAVHLSPHHFCRVFKRYTGMTIHSYRQFIRVFRATEDIFESDKALSSIATEKGFSDQAHMTRSIKQAFGVSPTAIKAVTSDLSKLRTMIQDAGHIA
jgi:AraC-like DNA-binding protein